MRARTILALALAMAPAIAHAESLEEIYARGNAAYFRGDFDAASREYGRLVSLGVVDPDVTYNLAASEARRGRYGAAILFFERTLVLAPGDDDAERALASVRGMLGRRRAASRGEAEVDSGSVGDAIFGSVSPDMLAFVLLAFVLVLSAALSGLLFARNESVRLGLGIAAVLSGIGVLVFGSGLALRAGWLDEGEPAVVLEERVPLREGPDPRSGERHTALEGQRAWVLDRDRGWTLVRIAGVGEGWAAPGQLGMIRP
jgi:tetratricopeptide (TPR) repeat protein